MTGNTLTQNPITGATPYTNSVYGTPHQGFWGNVGGYGVTTPYGFNTPLFQTQVPTLFNQQYGTLNPLFTGQNFQQPGMFSQPTNQWQTGFTTIPQMGFQGIQSPILQTTPPQVLNTILQTTPPQVLPFILNALACQQACQQVLAQNPQAVQGINPQAITQPFVGQVGITGFGVNPLVGYVPQLQQGACVGCQPGTQQWGNTIGLQGGFGQFQPQQPWFATTYGTW
jgi:hypothetical protein